MSPADSPRESWSSSPRRIRGVPPSSATPTSNETRVRVEGLSNSSATLLPASRSAPSPLDRPAFNSSARSSRALRSSEVSSSPVKKSRAMGSRAWYAADRTYLGRGDRRHHVEPVPRPRLSARPGALHVALAPEAGDRAKRHPRPGQPGAVSGVRRSPLRRALGRSPATGMPATLVRELAAACKAVAQRSLTSRNSLGPVRGMLARWNPDLLGSWEGGSNLTLFERVGADGLLDRRDLVLRRRPERRTMAFARLDSGLCVANLHASTSPRLAAEEVRRAAQAAVAWAGESPLVLGGDSICALAEPAVRGADDRFGLGTPTGPDSIDHILGEGSRSSTGRAPGRPRRGRCPARDFDCASATTPRSKPGSPAKTVLRPAGRRNEIVSFPRRDRGDAKEEFDGDESGGSRSSKSSGSKSGTKRGAGSRQTG